LEGKTMSKISAWAVFLLGIVHIVFGILRFKVPLTAAVADGFFGQFYLPELRRTAFWFLMAGPLFMLAGHIAIHAVAVGDLRVLRLIGGYMLVSSLVGVAAFPVSPLWAPLLLSLPLIAASYGWVA
jgi:uncharacterized membrane protein HdeD (DUF308 family)